MKIDKSKKAAASDPAFGKVLELANNFRHIIEPMMTSEKII